MSVTAMQAKAEEPPHQLGSSALWVKSPRFDLAFVSGGAFFTLGVAALAFGQPVLLPVLFWMWVVMFEGSHFWATFSRTYIDPDFRARNRTVLIGSLIFFVLPAMAILLERSNPAVSYTTLYALFIFVWSLYHNARQHYGFMSIYSGKAKMPAEIKGKLTLALYMCVAFAQIHFLLNFKVTGVFGLASASEVDPTLGFLVGELPKWLSLLAACYLVRAAWLGYREIGTRIVPAVYYVGVCLIFYTVMFYGIAPRDRFVQNLGGAETLMLIAIMNSLFHNIQYHAIVWHYGQRRYRERATGDGQFGLARLIGGNTAAYIGAALLMGATFGAIVWHVGDWPSFAGAWTASYHAWAYVLFFGIIGHHFFLDQFIWRPSRQKDLKTYLDGSGAAALPQTSAS